MQYSRLNWRDGQPFSENFDDIYYSSNDGELISGGEEFAHVFFRHNGLPERWQGEKDFVIAELGFGSGLNCILTIREWLKHLAETKSKKRLHYIAIEKYPLSPETIAEIITRYPELKIFCDELTANYPPAIEARHSRQLFDNRIIIHYRFMDAEKALSDDSLRVDAWYLDGFSPAKNADMWSQDLFLKIARNSHQGTTCSSYTCAGQVKRNLQNAGFVVSKTPGYGRKREMLVARLEHEINTSYRYADKPWYVTPPAVDIAQKKATIIGAGIAGLSIAHSLISRGWSIDIIDRQGDVGRETSANPAAITYPRLAVNNDLDTEFYTVAFCYNLYALKMLQQKYAKQFWFDSGLLQLMDSRRFAEIVRKYGLNEAFVSYADEEDERLASRYPATENEEQVYVEYKTAGVVLPGILCDALKAQCGDRLNIIHAEVGVISRANDRWQCLSADEVITDSEILIIANGTGINDLGLPIHFPIETVRGQAIALTANADSEKITKAVNSAFYITPAIAGKHYVGGTYSRENKSVAISADDNRELFEAVDAMFPAVFTRQDCCDAWAGLRTMSKDRVAVVGTVPDPYFFNQEYADICHGKVDKEYQPARYLENLYVSAAHGSRGFTSSFIAAEIVAALIQGEPLPVSKNVLDYICPSRFIVNDLKRR